MKNATMTILAAVSMILAVGNASASISWHTEPVLGTAATLENGDVTVETDSGTICIPGNQNTAYGNGVSMSVFYADPETGFAAVAHGSSANVDVSLGYTISTLWYLNGEQQFDGDYVAMPNSDVSAPDYELFWGTEMLGVGNWTYTETWISPDSLDPITYTAHFTVVPEPASTGLLLLGGLGLLRRRKA